MKDSGKGGPFSTAVSGARFRARSNNQAIARRRWRVQPAVETVEARALLSTLPLNVAAPEIAAHHALLVDAHHEAEVTAARAPRTRVGPADAPPAQGAATTTEIVATIIVVYRRVRVSLDINVAAADPGLGTPSGSVQVQFGSRSVTAPLQQGSAHFFLPSRVVARKQVTASYTGDAAFAPSQSPSILIIPRDLPHVALPPVTA